MRYFVSVNKKYHYIKVYNILKKNEGDMVSRIVSSFVDRFFLKKNKAE